MEQETGLQFFEPLRQYLRSLNRNGRCIAPRCTKKPRGSHVIAESKLKLLKDAQGKILSWEHTDEEILVNWRQGNTWDHIYQQPKRIGAGKDATYPMFCETHDNDIFAPLEKPGDYSETEQAALLAYRALCYKTWSPHLEASLEFRLSNQDSKTAEELRRVFALNSILAARKKFEYMIEHKDYRDMQWIKRILPMRPCIACTNAVIPFDGDEDAANIASGKTVLTAEDCITFTLYPDEKLNTSICVVTCFKNNDRGDWFISDLDPANSSETEVFDRIFNRALSCPLVYMSQEFWDFLSSEYKKDVVELQMRRIPLSDRPQD